jgi:uncharacterized protein (TIGR03000 family)
MDRPRTRLCHSLLSTWILCGLASLVATPVFAQGPRDRFPPSYYGYNLDDQHPGYYGGGRYNEYYKFGRGFFWLDNFPDSVPWYPEYRPWIRWKARPPAEAFEEVVLPAVAAPCQIGLRVPADAEVFVEDAKSRQTGSTREFVSPPLNPGQIYQYTVRARWQENGKPVEQRQQVTVRSGSRTELVFPVPPPSEPLPEPKPLPADVAE